MFPRCCLGILFVTLFSCEPAEKEVFPLTPYQQRVILYFKEVATGFEFNKTSHKIRKWTTPMHVFVGGQKNNTVLLSELNKTIREINQLSTDGFYVTTTTDSLESNCYIFLGARHEFLNLFPEATSLLGSNFGLFTIWYQDSRISRAQIFVDTERPLQLHQRSTLKEELTQALGLGKDSPRYPESIFYETEDDGGFATEYAPIDKDVIRLLYHPNMKPGIDEAFLNFVLIDIYQRGYAD